MVTYNVFFGLDTNVDIIIYPILQDMRSDIADFHLRMIFPDYLWLQQTCETLTWNCCKWG